MTQPRSSHKVNINEQKIFVKFENLIKNLHYENKDLVDIQKDMVLDLLSKDKENNKNDTIDYQKEINKLVKRQEDLVDMKLD
jgi:hypothetical protein